MLALERTGFRCETGLVGSGLSRLSGLFGRGSGQANKTDPIDQTDQKDRYAALLAAFSKSS